jgi:hypothetical protein
MGCRDQGYKGLLSNFIRFGKMLFGEPGFRRNVVFGFSAKCCSAKRRSANRQGANRLGLSRVTFVAVEKANRLG